jgi:hypothetical protein
MMKVIRWLLFLLLLIGLLLLVRPDDAITLSFVQRADEFRASIDYGLATDYLRVAVLRQPWNATLHVKLAEALALQHDKAGAQQALAEAERLGVGHHANASARRPSRSAVCRNAAQTLSANNARWIRPPIGMRLKPRHRPNTGRRW